MASPDTKKAPEAPAAPIVTKRHQPVEPTVSNDDPKLYEYTNKNAPDDVVINIGTSSLIVSAPAAVNDPHRMEVGDRRRGSYYLSLLGKLPGYMKLKMVDDKRLEAVEKIRDIRTGKREEDWIVEARKKSAEQGGKQPLAFNPHVEESPLQRAARGV